MPITSGQIGLGSLLLGAGGLILVAVKAKRVRRPWSLSKATVVSVTVVLVVTATLTVVLSRLFLGTFRPWHADHTVGVSDVVKLAFTIVAGLAGTQALVVAYRKQRDAERDQTSFTNRFGAAASQLGGSDPVVRIAGAVAMAVLADEWEHQRQQCVDVLCGYLRLRQEDAINAGRADEVRRSMRDDEVRRTILQIMAHRLRRDSPLGWAALDLNLVNATLVDTDFSDVAFEGRTDFSGATFKGNTRFNKSTFAGTGSFDEAFFFGCADFADVTFKMGCGFRSVPFERACFFDRAVIHGDAVFTDVLFRDEANFKSTSFLSDADFAGSISSARTDFDSATFAARANFKPSQFTSVAFFQHAKFLEGANFDGADIKNAAFAFAEFRTAVPPSTLAANFSNTKFGQAQFHQTVFDGQVFFSIVAVAGMFEFSRCHATELVHFGDMTVGANASFEDTTFEGPVTLGVQFAQPVDFNNARFLKPVGIGGAATFGPIRVVDLQSAIDAMGRAMLEGTPPLQDLVHQWAWPEP